MFSLSTLVYLYVFNLKFRWYYIIILVIKYFIQQCVHEFWYLCSYCFPPSAEFANLSKDNWHFIKAEVLFRHLIVFQRAILRHIQSQSSFYSSESFTEIGKVKRVNTDCIHLLTASTPFTCVGIILFNFTL